MLESRTAARLRVTEVFASVQGEASRSGLPTVFVRLTGCPLRCVWCDTDYAFHGGSTRSLDDLLDEVSALCDAGYDVSLETSGALDIGEVDPRVSRIVDLKAPGSGEVEKNLWSNLDQLGARDELKIVLADAADYDWARAQLDAYHLAERCPVLFSPVEGALDPATLAEWIERDRLPVRFQMQLHKILWADARGR